MEIYGTIISRTAAEQKTQTFSVQNFIVDATTFNNNTGQSYPNVLEFQVTGKHIPDFANIPDGARVKISFSPQGRWVDKKDGSGKFVAQNLNAYKFEIIAPPKPQNNGTETQSSVYNQ